LLLLFPILSVSYSQVGVRFTRPTRGFWPSVDDPCSRQYDVFDCGQRVLTPRPTAGPKRQPKAAKIAKTANIAKPVKPGREPDMALETAADPEGFRPTGVDCSSAWVPRTDHTALPCPSGTGWLEEHDSDGHLRDLAHDISSPAATIAMLARCVEAEEGAPSPVRQLALQIIQEADRIAELCADALEDPRLEAVRVDQVVAEVVENRAQVSGTRVELVLSSARTRAVRSGVARVAANLVDNAFRAAGPGGIVRVTVGERDRGVKLAVEDSGPGLPPDAWPAHDRRPVVSNNARREARGLGIVVRKVQSLGGTVEHGTSDLGGAELVVWLPAAGVARCALQVRHSS
jgi:anti-sigma regulatory factor (Ser/Thr protein kinase)